MKALRVAEASTGSMSNEIAIRETVSNNINATTRIPGKKKFRNKSQKQL